MKKIVSFLFAMGVVISSFANNIQITNMVVHQNSTTGGTVTFDISWDNSWYINTVPANWDAVWVFVKFRDCAAPSSSAFTHGSIDPTTANHTFGANLTAMTTGDGNTPSAMATASAPQGSTLDYSGATGVMLRRSTVTTGPVTTTQTGVTLSITNLPSTATTLTVHVEGIEMVYCLPGDFYIGDGDGAGSNFTTNGSAGRFVSSATATSGPMLVNNVFETSSTQTFYQMLTAGTVTTLSNMPASWPKGQYGFYMMKYEISEGLYTEFLNTLATGAQALHYYQNLPSYRDVVISNGSNLYTTARPDRTMDNLGWDDLTAFLDWACLRPMTETEFEKAARGTAASITNEYAWGGITANEATTFNTPPVEDGTETMTGGNAVFATTQGNPTCCTNGDGGSGPVRGGIFATPASIQSTAGAGYYGAMELSGNVREWVVAMSTTAANNIYTRQWGDGALASTGTAPAINNANVTSWPPPGTTVTASSGANIIGQRGGGAEDVATYLQISNRAQIYTPTAIAANGRGTYSYGGRGVR